MREVHVHRILHLKGIEGVFFHKPGFLHLLEKGGGIPGIVGVFLHKLGFLHLLEKGGGIPQLDRQIMKVPRSKAVKGEEFLVDISKSKTKSS